MTQNVSTLKNTLECWMSENLPVSMATVTLKHKL